MAPPAAADRESGGDRTLSWLDEDDPDRGNEPYMPLVLPPPVSDDPPPAQARRPRLLPRPRRSQQPEQPPPEPNSYQPAQSDPPSQPERVEEPDPPNPPRHSRKFLVVMCGLVAIVVAAAVVAAGTAYRLIFDRGPAPAERVATAPLGNLREAAFDLVTGTTTVTVRSADLGSDLYRIVTPRGSDILPRPVRNGGEVDLHLVPSGEAGPGAVDVLLTSRVTWRLRLTGGAVDHVVDMRAGRLARLELVGGATRAELTLPRPNGTVPIRMTGGVNQFLIHAPTGVLTRVRVGSGANTVNLDRLAETRIAPGTVFTPDGWSRGRARYDIDAAAGVATLRLDRTQ